MLSRLLEICERESVMKSECGISCWLVLPAARKRRERMYALSCWQVCPARKVCVEERESALSCWLDLYFLLLGSEERECVRCHVDRSVLLERPAWKREKVLCHVGWLHPAADQWGSEKRECEKWLARPFYVAPGRWLGQNGISHSHWVKYINSNYNG